jgi:MFS family permease
VRRRCRRLAARCARRCATSSYLCLHAGFFTCGFHIAFLVTHLPGEVALCGLPAGVSATALGLIGLFNIAGSLIAGALGQRYRMKWLLAAIYGGRASSSRIYLLAPKTPLTFYLFAAALGFSWLATVPPTAGLVGKLFGTRYLSTLFGLTLLSHQIGGFFGAWLGGLAFVAFGDYAWMWYADIVLAGSPRAGQPADPRSAPAGSRRVGRVATRRCWVLATTPTTAGHDPPLREQVIDFVALWRIGAGVRADHCGGCGGKAQMLGVACLR